MLEKKYRLCNLRASFVSIANRKAMPKVGYYAMIFPIAYSTMPRAPAVFSSGTIVRTIDFSTIVLMLTQLESDSSAMVGFCKAGN